MIHKVPETGQGDQWYWMAYGYALCVHNRTDGKTPGPHSFAEFYAGYGGDYGDVQAAWWAFLRFSDYALCE